MSAPGVRRVLNIGSGPADPARLHGAFDRAAWHETRLDIEPGVAPDIVSDMRDMRQSVADASFEAIWSSHNLEHLPDHDVPRALAEFARVLRPDGFALLTCPDVEAVARLILTEGIEAVAYQSPAGPVTAVDMLWGHGASVAAGHGFMAHRTGFTQDRLARLVLEAGFAELRVSRDRFALWALCLMPQCALGSIAPCFAGTPQAALVDGALLAEP